MIWRVESTAAAAAASRDLERWLWASGAPIGLDTETVGCNPKKQSPVQQAELWCLTLAWGSKVPTGELARPLTKAFIPREYIGVFRGVLEHAGIGKVGSAIIRYDQHVLRNMGIELAGIVGDTEVMSRLLNPSKNRKHGLKPLAESLGWNTIEYSTVARRRKRGKECLKKDGTASQNVNVGWEMVSLPELWRDYPQRRDLLVQYATQDAAMSLDVYWALRRDLENLKW